MWPQALNSLLFQVKVLAETRNRRHTKQLYRKILECYDVVKIEDAVTEEDEGGDGEKVLVRQSESSAFSEPGHHGKIRGGYTGILIVHQV